MTSKIAVKNYLLNARSCRHQVANESKMNLQFLIKQKSSKTLIESWKIYYSYFSIATT